MRLREPVLEVELEELQSEVVGAQLGSQAITSSILAAVIGLMIIIVFMIAVYRIPGLAASIALLIYWMTNKKELAPAAEEDDD